MGLLVQGKWVDRWYDTEGHKGHFERSAAKFRNWITADGSAGPSGQGGFKAEAGRYHLYVSLACPWANRTLIFRHLKGLEEMISLSVVHWHMAAHGWTFEHGDGVIADPLLNAQYLHQVYTHAEPDYSGRVTVPVLWDKQQGCIVNNESREILRMFSTAMRPLGTNGLDLCPEPLRAEVDERIDEIYEPVNNGVYRAGFARTQAAYEEAVSQLFAALERWDGVLAQQRYLCGGTVTEADLCFFTTLVRFDAVYHGHFKCNRRRIVDYPQLWPYLRDLYQLPGVAETVSMEHIRTHYYWSHTSINPTQIVAVGPDLDFMAPHGREALGT